MMTRLFRLAIIATVVQVGFSQNEDDIPGMNGMPGMQGMPGMGGAPCPKYRCSGGHVPVQKSRAKFVSMGCSSMGGGMMMMAGGGDGGGEKYDVCCDQWHACYQTCGVAKESCDEAFKSCSAGMCAGDEQCKKDADLKSMMLSFGGCQLFDKGQYSAFDPEQNKYAKMMQDARDDGDGDGDLPTDDEEMEDDSSGTTEEL
eukprot:scaffold9776_cov51-Attheya_sp.AAC.2